MIPSQAAARSAALDRILALRRDPVVARVAELSAGRSCHLVGGVVRDAWLDRPPHERHDVDVVVSGGGRRLALDLAEALPARFVHLGGKAFAAFRLVGAGFEVDLWDREGMSFEADLARRDLTLNALALDLHPETPEEGPVDLFGGLADLERRVLRATTSDSFADDPLRVLRLPRFLVELPGFSVDPATVDLARASATGLSEVAPERVREELERIFGVAIAAEGESRFPAAVRVLEDTGLTRVLVEREGVVDAEGFGVFEGVAAELAGEGEAVDLLAGRLALWAGAGGLDRLAERGHCTREVVRRARIAQAESARVAETVGETVAARRFLHRAGPLWPTALAVAAARGFGDWREPGRRLRTLADIHGDTIFDPPRYVTGRDLQQRYGLEPGPRVGEVLRSLRQAQVDGEVSSAAEAHDHVERELSAKR